MAKFKVLTKSLTTGVLGALGAAALLSGSAPAQAQGIGQELLDAVTGGKFDLDLRNRLEHVTGNDVNGNTGQRLKDANAWTQRTVAGYRTGRFRGFGVYGSFVNISHFNNSAFNSTVNGNTSKYVVADPRTTEISQAYVSYDVRSGVYGNLLSDYMTDTRIRYGRQMITFQNHRWIGNVQWRQKYQMYDGTRLHYTLAPFGVNFNYAFIYNVRQIFTKNSGNRANWRMSSHFFNLDWDLKPLTGLSAHVVPYAYLFDYANGQPVGRSVPVGSPLAGQASSRASNKNLGIRVKGDLPLIPGQGPQGLKVLYTGEFAHQSAYAGGSSAIHANYIFGTLGLGGAGISLTGNYELLGGNGRYALQTPFATLHAMNGWADQFTTTPAQGLQDMWMQLDAASSPWVTSMPALWQQILGGFKMSTRYHNYNSDQGNIHYGQEIDVRVTKALSKQITLLVKYANYWADGDNVNANGANVIASNLVHDTQKWWVQGEFKF